MPTWGEILIEVNESARSRGGNPDFDGIRRKYLRELRNRTGRPVIAYYTDWLGGGGPETSIILADMQGMMEVCKGIAGPKLDLILHSPGGDAEATASIVSYLRKKYTDIRVFVPLAAMSAATMWALAGNKIVMGKHSQLGPIDPQFISPNGASPARAIIQQFERAKQECSKDPSLLGAWLPILQQYGPALIQQCEAAEALARRLVGQWLQDYMFGGDTDASIKASVIADYFANWEIHQSHNLGIDRDAAKAAGVRVDDLEDDSRLQDALLSVHHAMLHTFHGPAIKIIENHAGKAYVRMAQQVMVQVPMQTPPTTMPTAPPHRLPGLDKSIVPALCLPAAALWHATTQCATRSSG